MDKVIIPNNTNNAISRVMQHSTPFRTQSLFLGSLEATHCKILSEYKITAILTVGVGLEVSVPKNVAHKVISIEDHPQ